MVFWVSPVTLKLRAPVVVPILVPFCNIVYPVTPTLSVEAVQERFVVVVVVPLAAKLLGADGGWLSGAVEVVTFAVLLTGEIFPAASLAVTVKA